MALSIALIVIVAGSVLLHLFSPWWTQPLASNWQRVDDTLAITLLITGAFFVAIHGVIIYAVLRWRLIVTLMLTKAGLIVAVLVMLGLM
jgi:cytochrome c oxidase subunit 2